MTIFPHENSLEYRIFLLERASTACFDLYSTRSSSLKRRFWIRFDPRKKHEGIGRRYNRPLRISAFTRFLSNLFWFEREYASLVALYRFCLLNLFLSSTTSNRFSRKDRSEERDFERNVLSGTFWPAARNFFPTSDHAFTFVRYIDIWPRLVPIFRGDVRLSSV